MFLLRYSILNDVNADIAEPILYIITAGVTISVYSIPVEYIHAYIYICIGIYERISTCKMRV